MIGDSETPASAGDVDVGGVVVQLAAGYQHTCAVLDDGAVRCWGACRAVRRKYRAGHPARGITMSDSLVKCTMVDS